MRDQTESSVLFSAGAGAAYATDILAILDLYFKMPLSMVPSVILLLTTQCIGFGLAGECLSEPSLRTCAVLCRAAVPNPRNGPKPTGLASVDVLALYPSHRPALYDSLPLARHRLCGPTIPDIQATPGLPVDLPHHLHVPVPAHVAFPHSDVRRGPLFGK